LGLPAELNFEYLDVAAPWPAGPFDIVSLVDVMHHVPPPFRRSVIEQCYQALRPGGTLIYKDIGDRPAWRATANQVHDLLMTREWVSYTPIKQLLGWAGEIGFPEAPVERINRLWYGHDLVLLKRPEAL
ncbi:MAG: class I SAM-dependent methyltransferase, partial [Thermoleophilia bacterium]|nr:class I SAM-dependent methyltransferase [Thermoleophilia bacterium]